MITDTDGKQINIGDTVDVLLVLCEVIDIAPDRHNPDRYPKCVYFRRLRDGYEFSMIVGESGNTAWRKLSNP